jgi:hypothetical protein
MLPYRLFELACATAYAGEGVLALLLQELRAAKPGDIPALRRQCEDALALDLEQAYSRRFRKPELDRICALAWPSTMFSRNAAPLMSHLFTKLMQHEAGSVQYVPAQVQDYVHFAGRFDPTCLVGWHVASEMHGDNPPDAAQVRTIVQAQQPFHSAAPAEDRPYTDGHVHINGLQFDGIVLMNQMWPRLNHVPKEAQQFTALSALAQVLLAAPRLQLGPRNDAYTSSQGAERLRADIASVLDEDFTGDPGKVEWTWLAQEEPEPAELGWHWLRRRIGEAVDQGNLAGGWLWFHTFLWWQYLHPKATSTLRICIYYLQGNLMRLRRQLIMDGVGLGRFVDINGRLLRKSAGDASGIWNARTLLQGSEDRAEIKVGPDFFTSAQIRQFLKTLVDVHGGELADKAGTELRLAHQWHICVHFARKHCHYKMDERQKLWKAADDMIAAMASSAKWEHNDLLNFPAQDIVFRPANWIRGFDVVGDENEARIDVYAPMLRWLRAEDVWRRKASDQEIIPRPAAAPCSLYLSVHAGEDYPHPLWGMRHIDETVKFCGMRAGDRLGHALAMGIDPRVWCERHGDMLLTASDHLDNLVWAWHYAKVISELVLAGPAAAVPDLARRAKTRFAHRIAALAPHVPWATGNPGDAPREAVLHDAWHYRRNCPYQYREWADSSLLSSELIDIAVPDKSDIRTDTTQARAGSKDGGPDMNAGSVYVARSQAYADVNRKEKLVMLTPGGRGEPYLNAELDMYLDHDGEDELAFMAVLQDYLLEAYRELGIVIETNPTSNLYIARLNAYREHPIYRWAPPESGLLDPGGRHNLHGLRKGPMKVTVNTDDPGIMPTTLRTEFLLIREAGYDQCSAQHVDDWVEQLRLDGNELFASEHVPVWTKGAAPS